MTSSLQNFIANSHILSFLSFLLLSILLYKWLLTTKSNTKLNFPPSPPKLPIIGHLHMLGKLPHRSLRSISNKYGEIMLLYLGHKPTLVVSSSKYAKEIMKTHDLIFANRPRLRFIDRLFYDGNDVTFNSYCSKWRHMKSICVLQLLSKKKVNSFRSTREEEVALMIEKIRSYNGSIFNLSEAFMSLSCDLICRAALGRKYTNEDGIGENFHRLFKDFIHILGAVSVGDYIPMLGWIDKLTGLESRVESVRKQLDDFMEEVVQVHQARISNVDEKNVKDFVDVLLEIQREEPDQLSRDDIKAITLDMFGAGTETSSTTLKWAMTELLRHPTIMKKLQAEVRNVVGTNTKVIEDDLENMNYLDAVLKETLRLHPAAPLLVFRESYEDVKIHNYDITSRTQVIINAWAIQRDPEIWQDSENFFPERFLNMVFAPIDYMSQNFEFIPFGVGRRSCPGILYGIINTKFILASLIYEFNWTLPNEMEDTTLEVEESAGIVVGPCNPLKIIASPNIVK